MHWFMKTKKN